MHRPPLYRHSVFPYRIIHKNRLGGAWRPSLFLWGEGGLDGGGAAEVAVDYAGEADVEREEDGDQDEGDEEGDEADADELCDAAQDDESDEPDDADEEGGAKDGPFVAVGALGGQCHGLGGVDFFVNHQADSQAPADGDDDAGDKHEHHSGDDRYGHHTDDVEELAHIFAVFAVKDGQGIYNLSLADFDGNGVEQADGGADVDVGDPACEQPKDCSAEERGDVFQRGHECFLHDSHYFKLHRIKYLGVNNGLDLKLILILQI